MSRVSWGHGRRAAGGVEAARLRTKAGAGACGTWGEQRAGEFGTPHLRIFEVSQSIMLCDSDAKIVPHRESTY